MSVAFLRQIAVTPLPKSFTNAKDIDAVKILRQAGLVIARVDPPPGSAATVFAITEEGNAELLRFHYPENGPETPLQGSQAAASRSTCMRSIQAESSRTVSAQ